MMKVLSAGCAAAILVLIVAPAMAQVDETRAIVNVPFRFIAADKLMPAGKYRVSLKTDDASVVFLSSVDTTAGCFVGTRSSRDRSASGSAPKLAFQNYDGQYFLARVALPGQDTRLVPMTREQAERTLVKLNLRPAEMGNSAR